MEAQDSQLFSLSKVTALCFDFNCPFNILQDNFTGRPYSEAYDSVKQGHNWGVIGLGTNFSVDLLERYVDYI